MAAECVLELLELLGAADVEAWIDGGWGVDALVGEQSRPHGDLDLVVALADSDRIRRTLGDAGFRVSDDQLPIRFVMIHPERGQIDFHTVTFDDEGGGLQPQPGGGPFRYPPEGFTAGRILSRDVPCISAEVQLVCHLGYEPTEKDLHDVLLLHRAFDLPLPPVYARLARERANSAGQCGS